MITLTTTESIEVLNKSIANYEAMLSQKNSKEKKSLLYQGISLAKEELFKLRGGYKIK